MGRQNMSTTQDSEILMEQITKVLRENEALKKENEALKTDNTEMAIAHRERQEQYDKTHRELEEEKRKQADTMGEREAIRCTLEEERKDLGAAQREAQATEQKVLAMQEHTEYLEGLVREKNSLIEDLKSDLIKANEKVDTLEKEIKSGAALLPAGLTAAASDSMQAVILEASKVMLAKEKTSDRNKELEQELEATKAELEKTKHQL